MTMLPEGWTETLLEDSVEIVRGVTFSKSDRVDEARPGYIPCLRTSNVQEEIETDDLAFIPANMVKDKRRLVSEGDVLISMSNSAELVGKVAKVRAGQHGFAFGAFLSALRSKRFEPDFLYHLLRSGQVQAALRRTSSQTVNIANLSISGMAKIPLPVPPLDEQRRIAAKLDSLFKHTKSAREELARIPRLVERYKRAILAAAFDGTMTSDWRTTQKLPSPRAARLAELVDEPIRNGLSVRGSDNPPGVRSLRLSALRTQIVDTGDVRFLPISDTKAQKYLLRDGDILVSRGNGTKALVGIAARVEEPPLATIFPDTAFRIRLARKVAEPQWFTLMWNAPQVRSQIENSAKTTAGIWKVSQVDLSKITLTLPSIEEQREITRRLQISISRINQISLDTNRAAELVNRLEQSTLEKAFHGDLTARATESEYPPS